MGISDREDFHGRIADRINLANDRTTGTKEMIAVLSGDKIKQYLAAKSAEKVEIADKEAKKNDRPDFSDLLDL